MEEGVAVEGVEQGTCAGGPGRSACEVIIGRAKLFAQHFYSWGMDCTAGWKGGGMVRSVAWCGAINRCCEVFS